jgi:hypothetical protein
MTNPSLRNALLTCSVCLLLIGASTLRRETGPPHDARAARPEKVISNPFRDAVNERNR